MLGSDDSLATDTRAQTTEVFWKTYVRKYRIVGRIDNPTVAPPGRLSQSITHAPLAAAASALARLTNPASPRDRHVPTAARSLGDAGWGPQAGVKRASAFASMLLLQPAASELDRCSHFASCTCPDTWLTATLLLACALNDTPWANPGAGRDSG